MKKFIAAAAGLMLAGTMASTAVADVTFGGDARARYYNQQDYNLSDSDNSFFNSRVRLQAKATTKGNAYAIGRFRMGEATWDGTQQTRAGGEKSNLLIDKAYIGVPFGPVTIEAGLTYRDLSKFGFWARPVDSVEAIYKADNTTFRAFLHMLDEFEEFAEGDAIPEGSAVGDVTPGDAVSDDDKVAYGVKLDQKFGAGWGMTAYAAIQDDSQADTDGVFAGLVLSGALGAATVEAGVDFLESDLVSGDDDALGAYLSATVPLGAASIYGVVGTAQDGFVVDDDFNLGFIIGNYTQISGFAVGSAGDTTFGFINPSFKASQKLTLGAALGYYDIDGGDGDAFEIGANAAYAVTDGAALKAILAYADFDDADENPLGFGLSLEVSF